jgi:hypothetical protein
VSIEVLESLLMFSITALDAVISATQIRASGVAPEYGYPYGGNGSSVPPSCP